MNFQRFSPKKLTEVLLTSKVVQNWPSGSIKRWLSQNVQHEKDQKQIGYWLMGCAVATGGGLAFGGITRLSEGKWNMFNWDKFRSLSPPRSEEDWRREFDKCKSQKHMITKESGEEMSLEEFKKIWKWEAFHHRWGQALGLAFLVPCAYFWYKGRFDSGMKLRMVAAGALLGGHLFDGWRVVQSGLGPYSNVEAPHVSQYRMVGHLGSVYGLYALFLWSGLSHLLTPINTTGLTHVGNFRKLAFTASGAVFMTVLIGGLVASLDAGRVYNSWPGFKQGDKRHIIPNEILQQQPKWRNFVENQVTVQFMHRHMAYFTLATITATWLVGRRLQLSSRARTALNAVFGMAIAQAAIGITALLNAVPTSIGSLHQNGSLALVTLALWMAHEVRRLPK